MAKNRKVKLPPVGKVPEIDEASDKEWLADLVNCYAESEKQGETILEEAARITAGPRQRDYDHPYPNHQRIARLWTAYLDCRKAPGSPLLPEDVATMMILLKIARHVYRPRRDSLVDIAGYARCLEQIADVHPDA